MFKEKGVLHRYKLDFKLIREIDKGLLISMVLLVIYGIFNIYLCTKGGATSYGEFFFMKKQAIWFVISMVALYLFVAVDYRVIYRYVPLFYWGSILLLISVWIPGIGVRVNGARGWIDLIVMRLQPAELAKFGMILMLAKLLDDMDCQINNIKNLSKIALYMGLPVALIVIQPDMGMTMVCFFIVLGMLFIAGLDRRIITGGFLALFLAVVIAWNSGIIQPYQKSRILAFTNPESDDSDSGYQLNQALIGIGSGGLFGSRPSINPNEAPGYAGNNVPEVQTDFIFSAISEQWGFVGALIVLGLYGTLISRMIIIAKSAKDRFASFICMGMVSYFLFAITQNIGMNIGLIPITGITLPLLSYGGSSLLTTTMAVALVLNIGMRKKKISF